MQYCRSVLTLAAVLSAAAIMAQEFEIKTGPGTMRLSSLATLKIPAGYSYREFRFNLDELRRHAMSQSKPAVAPLAAVASDSTPVFQFIYLYDPAPPINQTIWRVQAVLHLHTIADGMAQTVHQKGILSGRVLERDHYDPVTATIRNQVGFAIAGARNAPPIIRLRTVVLLGRHGAMFAEFEAPDGDFAAADARFNTLLQSFSYVPGESPGWTARLSPAFLGRWLADIWIYALTGLLIGIGLALLVNRRRTRAATVEAVERSVAQSV